jgi:DNA replication protein DnaC
MNSSSTNYQQLILNLDYLELKQMTLHMMKSETSAFAMNYQLSIPYKLTSYEIDVLLDFLTLCFLESNGNIVFLGSSGVGKTHLATSIGIAVAKKRTSTYFIKCHHLIQNLKRARLENRLESR